MQNSIRYRGYVYDNESGWYYLQSRYYDPEICRFINADNYSLLTASPTALTDKNLFAYCDSNPIVRIDVGGNVWETVFDVASLGVSVVEVCINPTDVWAWAGLVGDAIDLVPFVTGAGEATRAIKVAKTAIKNTDNVIDVAKHTKKQLALPLVFMKLLTKVEKHMWEKELSIEQFSQQKDIQNVTN